MNSNILSLALRPIFAVACISLSSCIAIVDKEYTALEARMPALTNPKLVIGMWHNKIQGGVPGITNNISHSLLCKPDGTAHFRGGGGSTIFGKLAGGYETQGTWRYEGPGRWIVKMDDHPENWYVKTDGKHLLSKNDFLIARFRSVLVRADDEAAIREERRH